MASKTTNASGPYKDRELAEEIAWNVMDDIHEAVKERTSSDRQYYAVMSQLRSIFKKYHYRAP